VVREAAKEPGVSDEASPALAHGGGAREGGRLRLEAEEDLPEQIVAFERGGQGRRRGTGATHVTWTGWGTGERDGGAGLDLDLGWTS
jgi:hypothetical protein